MFVWHRNAMINYLQYIFSYTCMIASQSINIKLTKQGKWKKQDIIERFNPILTLAVLVLLKTLMVRHKN